MCALIQHIGFKQNTLNTVCNAPVCCAIKDPTEAPRSGELRTVL